MKSKKTVVLGASTNPDRYSYLAVNRLKEHGHEVVPVGIKKGEVAGIPIINELDTIDNVDTVSLYVGPSHQAVYFDFILGLKPKRVIFNPGTYNEELIDLLEENKIEILDACTLVMLSANTY